MRTLGAVDLRTGDGQAVLTVLAQPKRLALLVYVAAASRRGAVSRDLLLSLFWPDADQASSRQSLNQALTFLRRALGAEAIVSRAEDAVSTDSAAIRLDAAEFEEACASRDFAGAVERYRGDFLSGLFVSDASSELDEWIAGERARLKACLNGALWSLADDALAAGHADAASKWAHRAVEEAPDDERGVRRLIELLARVGDRAGGLRAFETFAARLEREYGVTPAAETVAAVALLRASPAATGGATAPRMSPDAVDAGTALASEFTRRQPQNPLPAGRGRAWVALAAVIVVVTAIPLASKSRSGSGWPGIRQRVDPAAFTSYTKGRYYGNKGGIANLERARTLFTQALDIDPTYAAAYGGLADTYNQLGYAGGLPPGEAFPKAKKAASRALDLDSSNAEAHGALAYSQMYYDWDFVGAEREFLTAIKLNPNWATAHDEYSLYLLAMGRFDEAESEVQRAVALDPLSAPIAGEAGWVSHYRGRQDEALVRMKAAVAMDTSNNLLHFQLGRVLQAQNRFRDALQEYELASATGFVTGIGSMGYVEGALGDRAAARVMRAKLDSVTRSGGYTSPYVVALVHTGLGDRDSAFVWLNRAVNEHTHWVLWLNRDPRWDALRADPRFLELTRRIPLPP